MGNGKVEEMEELKKCPFCGGEAKIYKLFDYISKYRVECTYCDMYTSAYATKEEAIEAWNRRVEE